MASPYDKIIEMIKKLDLQDDGIKMNMKIKSIEQDFCTIVRDEKTLSQSMEYINDAVLSDNDASLKFALLFSSRNFDSLAMNDTKVRSKMLKILEFNFLNAEYYKKNDKNRLYNSITLLGEYFHRVRLADGSPIAILGESLLRLLTQEIGGEEYIDLRLAKLVLSQVTLNGSIMRSHHEEDLSLLLYHIRRNFIEQPKLTSAVKALLLMTLDLYYSNFSNLGHMLEEMYTKYLVGEDSCEVEDLEPPISTLTLENGNDSSFGSETSPSVTTTTKKWSEQVNEDLYENENLNGSNNSYCDNFNENEENNQGVSNEVCNNIERDHNQNRSDDSKSPQGKSHWRQKRFNQGDQNERNFSNNVNRPNRRFSASYDDDRHSVRSEGGSIRLYSVGDRLQHSQTKLDRSGNNNWDRQKHFRNFNDQRNSNNSRNKFDSRVTYDRPPRFRNNDQFKNSNGTNNDNTWRPSSRGPESNSRSSSRNRTLPRPSKSKFDHSNGGRRSQSPDEKSHNSFQNKSNPFARSTNNRLQHSRNFSRSNRYSSQNSLASETTTGTWDRRNHHRRNNHHRAQSQDWDETRSIHGQPEENTWDGKDNNSELVKNARNTAKYMQYLSQK